MHWAIIYVLTYTMNDGWGGSGRYGWVGVWVIFFMNMGRTEKKGLDALASNPHKVLCGV